MLPRPQGCRAVALGIRQRQQTVSRSGHGPHAVAAPASAQRRALIEAFTTMARTTAASRQRGRCRRYRSARRPSRDRRSAKVTRCRAEAGQPASAPTDQRTASTYIVGHCPKPKSSPSDGSGPGATRRCCSCIRGDQPARSLPAGVQRCCRPRLDGRSPPSSPCPTTSRSDRCRRNRPNSTRRRTSGSVCAATGAPIGCSTARMLRSITAAMPGTNSRPSHGPSCSSDCGNGPIVPGRESGY